MTDWRDGAHAASQGQFRLIERRLRRERWARRLRRLFGRH